MSITISQIVMMLMGGLMSLQWWNIKKYITKVDQLDSRVTKIETVLGMLGDINTKIGAIETDVAVIKSKLH